MASAFCAGCDAAQATSPYKVHAMPRLAGYVSTLEHNGVQANPVYTAVTVPSSGMIDGQPQFAPNSLQYGEGIMANSKPIMANSTNSKIRSCVYHNEEKERIKRAPTQTKAHWAHGFALAHVATLVEMCM